jgi:hypothetical protein
MKKPIVKRQHFVPQYYLKYFCDKDEMIWWYDKKSDLSKRQKIREVGHQKYFYDIEDVNERQVFEQVLAELDGAFSAHLRTVNDTLEKYDYLLQEARFGLAQMIFLQQSRTPRHRAQYQQLAQKNFEIWYEATYGKKVEVSLKPKDEAFHQLKFFIESVKDSDIFSIYTDKHFWVSLYNETDVPFITSDHPVVTCTSDAGRTQLVWPISPKRAIVLLEKHAWPEVESNDGRTKVLLDKDGVNFYNYLQIKRSMRHIYGPSSDFSFAKEICDLEPELRDVGRKLINFSEPKTILVDGGKVLEYHFETL